ncbi:MAG TPA: hypothetical protein VJR29_09935 [bacterium]|nr:hypothetical protein [bacterium]
MAAAGLGLALAACAGIGGFATGSKEGGEGVQAGGALDEFNSGGQVAGLGPGGFPGAGGGMGPLDPDQPGGAGGGGGGGSPGGGGTDPFGGVGGSPGEGGASPSGGGGECSGGICSSDTPVGTLIGRFNINATLFVDIASQGGNCNSLLPPPSTKQVCRYVRGLARPSGFSFASLWMGSAWALPRQQDGLENGGTEVLEGQLVCEDEPFQPPIDPALIPRVVLKSDRDLWTGEGNSQWKVNDVSFTPQCGASGQWVFTSPTIKVHLSPYPGANNTWVVQVDALYPQDGAWTLRGSKTVTMNCGWDPTGSFIQCLEQIPLPQQINVQTTPVQGMILSR